MCQEAAVRMRATHTSESILCVLCEVRLRKVAEKKGLGEGAYIDTFFLFLFLFTLCYHFL